jgi:hypothetical protein
LNVRVNINNNHTVEQLRSGALAGSKRLTLAGDLNEFPREIFELADTLEILDLSGNGLSALPDDLPRLRRLRILFCAGNRFTELPAVLGRCEQLEMIGFKANRIAAVPAKSLPPRLRWLILTDNRIEALPAEIGRCTRLQKLALAGNRLRELPAQLAACTRLELLRISANQLSGLPVWLLSMPRLSWLAFGGNPFCLDREQRALTRTPMGAMRWPQMQIQARLGEGASGVIYRAADGAGQAVAVKVFKGQLTSDGLPASEMAACIGAGAHPNLIPVLGRISEHPQGADGLVMQLMGPDFRSLAGPPSLDSCTRDVYAAHTRFGLDALLRLAGGVASALRHLHRHGISHGDLYGHNILHGGEGHAMLGDFGAASFFDGTDTALAEALQRIEVRAFGCLLEELLERSAPAAAERPLVGHLQALCMDCLDERPGHRPLFEGVDALLQEWAGSARQTRR